VLENKRVVFGDKTNEFEDGFFEITGSIDDGHTLAFFQLDSYIFFMAVTSANSEGIIVFTIYLTIRDQIAFVRQDSSTVFLCVDVEYDGYVG